MADEQNNAKTQIITNRGLELLGKSPLTGANQTYWLGYFGFAYVPDEIKEQYPKEVPSALRTTLTDHGDMIYNIWQGSMTPQGYQTDIGSSNAAELMTQCQYTNNIMSNFRYSLDKGRNTLSLYKRNADGAVTQWGETFQGAGVDDNDDAQNSALPIPAALYYSANSAGDGHVVTGDPRTYAANGGQWGASSDDWNKEPTDVLDQPGKEYVSNFNKYHAPAISEGYLQGQEPSCRNMSTVTKYFPVTHYTVTAAEGSKVSALKLTLTIDLNNIASKVANRTNFATMGADEKPLNPVGFKFNRIGIYAAAMAVHHYTYDEENNQCQPVNDVQYQVIGDEEPDLFAIIDLDQAITIEEGGSLGKWTTDIIINFGNGESADSPIPRDTVVYYNLYEDDSIVWYKNQLIANASTSEAVTNLGIELNYLKNQIENIRSGSSCVMVDDTPYALLNHTHDYMRNLLDSGKTSVINSAAARKMANKPFKSDVLAYVGSDEDRFNTLQWYSLDDNLLGIGRKLNGENPAIPEDAAIQSERSPMVYTGGLALGGYGDTDSNFMLLRLGSQIDPEHTAWPQLQYDSNGILRNPCMWVPSPDVVTTTPNTPGKIYVKYEPDGNNVNHLLTKSPYAGHVLMVLEDQEIDGTLRVGLGKVNNNIGGNIGIMVICEMEGADDTNQSHLPGLTVMMNGQFLDTPSDVFNSPGFSMEGITKILWYTPCSYLPKHTALYINMDYLTDGIVYEIEMNRTASVGNQASYEAMCEDSLGVYFTYNGSTITPYRWGGSQFGGQFVRGDFSVPNVTNGGASCTVKFDTQLYNQTSLPIQAVAKIYFMKLDDKMYVLGY